MVRMLCLILSSHDMGLSLSQSDDYYYYHHHHRRRADLLFWILVYQQSTARD